MRFKGAIILSMSAIAIGCVYFFYLLPLKEAEEKERELRERIFVADPQEVEVIRLKNSSGSYEIARQGEGWVITSPMMLMTDRKVILKIIESMNSEKLIKLVSTDLSKVGEFGLDSPPVYAGFGHGDTFEEFFIGLPTPSRAGVYMYKRGLDGIFLVSEDVAGALNQDLYGLRKKEPFAFEVQNLRGIVIDRKEDKVELVRKGDAWDINKPIKGKAGEKGVRALLDYLRNVRGDEFFDSSVPDPSDYSASARIRLYYEGNKDIELLVYYWGTEQDRGLVLYQPGLGYYARTNQRDLWTEVNQDAAVFRDRSLFGFEPDDVSSIEYESGEKNIILKRDGGRWKYGHEDVSSDLVGSFFITLAGAEAYSVVADGEFKDGPLTSALTIRDSAGGVRAFLHVYGRAETDRSFYDGKRGEIRMHYAESGNISGKVLVTSKLIEEIENAVFRIAAGGSG